MAGAYKGETYKIIAEPCHLLSDEKVKTHHYHYANGQQQFRRWITDLLGHRGEVKLNFFLVLANRFLATDEVLPEEALYDLQRWLRGRQFCYCHHLHKGNADEGHLHPIKIARQLVQLLRPDDSAEIIARCTPDNFYEQVKAHGSAKAQEMFIYSRSEDKASQTRSPYPAVYVDRSKRQRMMTRRSWRRDSDSSSVSSSDESRGRSCSFSSSTSLSSIESWRQKSNSPAKVQSTWVSHVVA